MRFLTVCSMVLLFAPANAEAQKSTTNPPPTRPLEGYATYELKPLEMGEPWAGQKANEKAKKKLQQHIDELAGPVVDVWRAKGPGEGETRSLTIEPHVADLKFIGGGARFWVGPLAGSSRALIQVKFVEQPSGTLVADAEFYQRASAMAGSFSMGAHDNDMLRRVISLFADYLRANASAAVGGPTGYEP